MKSLILIALTFLLVAPSTALAETTCATTKCSCTVTADLYSNTTTATDAASCRAFCEDFVNTGTANWGFICLDASGFVVGDETASGTVEREDGTNVGEEEVRDPVIPILNVPIPGLDFGESVTYDAEGNLQANFLAKYIDALYRFLIVAMAIVAVVMMMIGGLQYILARGHPDAVKKAKERMANSVIGLILLMAAYDIAFLINPDTVRFESLKISVVPFVPDDYSDSGDTAGTSVSAPGNVPTSMKCDSSYSLSEMAYSTMGKVTYRMGGKLGGSAPYSDDTSKVDANGVAYRTFCPDDQLCLDCSGYASMLLSCAGLPSAGGSTTEIFAGAAEITSYTATSINGTTLQPGDLIGAPGWHVVVYVGDGKIAESHGGTGRQKGNAIRVGQSLSDYIDGALTKDWGHNPLYFKRP